MDSDDDFLIEDAEDLDNELKDDLYQGTKTPPPTPNHSIPNTPSAKPSSSLTAIPLTSPPVSAGLPPVHSTGGLQSGHETTAHSHSLPTPGDPSPNLVVAPKPLSTATTTGNAKVPLNSTQTAPSTTDVLRGLQEGGNALLRKLGDFFQAPSAYIPASHPSNGPHRSIVAQDYNSEALFTETFSKFSEVLQNADSMTFPVLDDFINDFNGQESLRFDGSDLIEKQERDYFGLKEKRIAKLESLILDGKDPSNISDDEAILGIREQNESRDKAVADGEYQTKVLREHQSSRGQMFQNIVFCGANLFKKLLLWDGATEHEIALIPECIEEYLIPHVQKKLYCPDRWTDWRFAQLVGSTQFIQPRTLEITTPIDANLINRCGALLTEVNFLPTPRKKLAAMAQACRYIVNYLSEHPLNVARAATAIQPVSSHASSSSDASSSSSSSSTDPLTSNAKPEAHAPSSTSHSDPLQNSAHTDSSTSPHTVHHTDEFLATLIYILIQTNPPNLLSNVAYLITCRSSSESMLSDEGYFFAHVAIAVHFLCKLKESRNGSKVDLEGGVFLQDPEWKPMMLEKEARLTHLLPALNTERAQNEILEYKSAIRKLVLDIMRKQQKKKSDTAAATALIAQQPPFLYTSEQSRSFQEDPTLFFAEHRFWNSAPEEFKSPASVAHLLNEYKRLLASEYKRASHATQ